MRDSSCTCAPDALPAVTAVMAAAMAWHAHVATACCCAAASRMHRMRARQLLCRKYRRMHTLRPWQLLRKRRRHMHAMRSEQVPARIQCNLLLELPTWHQHQPCARYRCHQPHPVRRQLHRRQWVTCSRYATCTDITAAPGYSCTCNGCYSGSGVAVRFLGCYLPAPTVIVIGMGSLSFPPAKNTIRAGDSIRFRLSFGCNTGANIFDSDSPLARIPYFQVNVPCERGVHVVGDQIEIPLPQGPGGRGAWAYDARSFTYTFNFKTDTAWAGLCASLDLGVKDDGRRVDDADTSQLRFQLVRK